MVSPLSKFQMQMSGSPLSMLVCARNLPNALASDQDLLTWDGFLHAHPQPIHFNIMNPLILSKLNENLEVLGIGISPLTNKCTTLIFKIFKRKIFILSFLFFFFFWCWKLSFALNSTSGVHIAILLHTAIR